MKQSEMQKLLTTARDAAATLADWTAKREEVERLEQATLDELTGAIGKRTSKERLQALARAYRFVHAAAESTRATERGFWRNKDASAVSYYYETWSQPHRELMHAFTLWIQRQMKAQSIDDFTDAEARLATYLMQQDERGRPLSFRDIAEAEGCSAMAIKRRVDSLRKQHKAFSNWLERNIPRKPGRVALQKPNKTKKV